MRRVFPLRPSENCLLATYDAEGLHGKESKPDNVRCGGNGASSTVDSTSRLRRQNEANCHVFPSGDENSPTTTTTTTKRGTVGKPSSFQMPPRASYAYPVFTGGTSFGHPISRSARLSKSQELKRPSSDKERTPGSSTSRACCPLEGSDRHFPSNEITKGPCSNFGNHLSSDLPSRGNLRSSSMRILQAPDGVSRFRPAGGKFARDCDTFSDGRSSHSRSLSVAASEKSDAKSSENSSCFTGTTESSSSISLASDSSYSKKSSISGKAGHGNSPFKHLTPRMVAEKIVKVLGKEKLSLRSNKSNTPHASRSIKQDFDGSTKQDSDLPCEATVSEALSEVPFPTGTSCRSHHNREASGSIHFPEPGWLSSSKRNPLGTATLHDKAKESCMSANVSSVIWDPDVSFFQSLEARAHAREDLAAMLDREITPWDDKFTLSSTHDRHNVVDFSDEIALHSLDALRFEVSRLRREKKDLALEVAAEIRTRVSEQKAAADALRRMSLEMECQVSAIEKDKISVQGILERELESREEDWEFKLSKIRTEERRLRDRVTEIAEDRVELQKVIASFKLKEASWKAQAEESQLSLQMLKQRANASAAEVVEMKKSFTDVCSKLHAVDGELNSLAKRNKFLEMENKELQKEVLKLRRVCNDQEMTNAGLWQELDEAVNSTSQCRSENILRLQRELLRLAGVEQGLRNEMDAMHAEMASLKREKTMAQGEASMNLVNLCQELQGQMDGSQAQTLTLQDENRQLSLNLQAASRKKRFAECTLGLFPDSVERMNGESHFVTVLDLGEKGANSPQSNEVVEGSEAILEKDLNEEAKLFWKVQSGKLHLKDADLQHLDKEIAALMLSRDSLQIEVDNLHGKLIMANQRARELERQLVKRDDEIEVLQGNLQDRVKELAEARNELPCTRRQRDEMRKEAEDMSREALRLTLELTELHKVVEKLDEELMLKEGQISILRGTYGSGDI